MQFLNIRECWVCKQDLDLNIDVGMRGGGGEEVFFNLLVWGRAEERSCLDLDVLARFQWKSEGNGSLFVRMLGNLKIPKNGFRKSCFQKNLGFEGGGQTMKIEIAIRPFLMDRGLWFRCWTPRQFKPKVPP